MSKTERILDVATDDDDAELEPGEIPRRRTTIVSLSRMPDRVSE